VAIVSDEIVHQNPKPECWLTLPSSTVVYVVPQENQALETLDVAYKMATILQLLI
jgi:hypothetical protein